jgi:metal-responsive CopG/Arc/MetJ family transcriptional regulator
MYLDDDLWQMLHDRARAEGTTISELVRQAVRDRYSVDHERRRKAMMGIVGMWADREDIGDSTEYVRNLRRDNGRFDRLK